MNTLANAAADAVEALPVEDTTPEPVSVELPPEVVETPPAAPPAPAPVAAPKSDDKKRFSDRVAALSNDRNNLMAELEQERRRSAELTSTLQQRDQELTAAQVRQMDLHKVRLQTDATSAREELKRAQIEQDTNAFADATAKIARSESGLADVDAWMARNKPEQPAQPAAAKPAEPPRQAQQPQPAPRPIDGNTIGWIEDNPWFTPQIDGKQNPEFDRGMHLTAVAYAARLEDKLRAEGRESEIGKDSYWNEIDQHMAGQFPDKYDVTEGEAPPVVPAARPAPSPVAAAVRSQPTLGGAKPAGGKVLAQLTGAERQMADALRNSGSLLYPKDHPKVQANPQLRGQRMSAEDSYIAYGVQIRRDKQDQAIRRANNQ